MIGVLLALAWAQEPRPAPEASAPTRPSFPSLQEHALKSGLPVVFAQRQGLPLVQIDLAVAADLSSVEGGDLLATLASELLGTGTAQHDATAWKSALTALGAAVDLRLNATRLSASLRVPSGNEAAALELLAQALFEPDFREKTARVYLETWTQYRMDLPYRLHSVHDRGLNHAFFGVGHPLRHDALVEDLERLTARDAQALVATVLETGRASLSVAGDADPDTLLPLLEQHFGSLGGTLAPRPYDAVEGQGGRWVVDRSGFDIAKISVLVEGPPAGHEDEAAMRILTGLLAGSFDSRMSMDLREQRGLTYGVHGDMSAWKGLGQVRIDLDTPIESVGAAMIAAEAHLDAIETTGVTQAEVDRARAHLQLEQAHDFAHIETVANQIMLAQHWSLGLDVWERDLDALDAVTPADVALAAREWLVPERRVWVITGEGRRIQDALTEVGRAPDTVMLAEDLAAER